MHRFAATVLILTAALAACSRSETPPAPEVARPAKLYTVADPDSMMIRTFPGEVRASNEADMAFRVSGRIIEFPATRGQQVARDDLLARLDPADFQAEVDQQQAQYDLAVSQYQRAAELIDRQLISRADYDQRLSWMKVRESALNRARNDLEYTRLLAPFDGVVARQLSENFENVTSGQVVLTLQTSDMIDVVINVPESLIQRLNSEMERLVLEPLPKLGPENDWDIAEYLAVLKRRDARTVQVQFGANSRQRYTAFYKEHESNADPATLTFKVTFTLQAPETLNVLPGMSATVVADVSHLYRDQSSNATLAPVEAVFSDEKEPLDAEYRNVWIVDMDSMRASARTVRVGPVTGNEIVILEGLEPGETIIAAGVSAVSEGMLLRPMQRERGL